jgi:alkanesulfonate monooxygenase SsuD/methylene tetrahydromethanopterin reductase-like flavin-dependent oxidoreductase (luciferase family)
MLDEALTLVTELWSGDEVTFDGTFFTATGVRFWPTPVQDPRIPIWVGARGGSSTRPIRRAARYDGLFPVGATRAEVSEMVGAIEQQRGSMEGFEVAMIEEPTADVAQLERAGVTWLLRSVTEGETALRSRELIARGPC